MNEIFNESKEFSTKQNLEKLKHELKQANKPWIVNYLKESKDRKYNIYSYKLVQWWTKWWIKNKYEAQIWPRDEWTQFTDVNWNELKKERFEAWEVVYLRVPKKWKETSNSISEMTLEEIMKISDKEIKKLFENIQDDFYIWYYNSTSKTEPKIKKGKDNKWYYIILNSKKVYNLNSNIDKKDVAKLGLPFISITWEDFALATISIAKKVWNKYMWVSYNGKDYDKVYRWELEWESGRGCFVPKGKGQNWY